MGLDGKVKCTLARLKTPKQWSLNNKIKEITEKTGKTPMNLVRKLNEMCETQIFKYENVTTTAGRTMIMNNLTDPSPDNAIRISYGAVGDDNTTPVIGDTALGNETTRKLVGSETNSSSTGYITQFYTAAEAIDTHKETGLFSDATATTDSGVLVIHALISITKTGTDTLTIDHTIQLSDV